MFYDTGHLNLLGAQVFTKIIAGILAESSSFGHIRSRISTGEGRTGSLVGSPETLP
jgi:hypothetical protein